MKPMPYQQVKERVDREDKVLKKLVIDTGIGMLAALLLTAGDLLRGMRQNRVRLQERRDAV